MNMINKNKIAEEFKEMFTQIDDHNIENFSETAKKVLKLLKNGKTLNLSKLLRNMKE